MDPTQETSAALKAMQSLKSYFVRRDGIGADLPMFVLLLHDGVELVSFAVRNHAHQDRLLADSLALTDADAIVLGVDAYGLFDPTGDLDSDVSLATRFANGDRAVGEVLVVTTMTRDGDNAIDLAPYHYEGREVVWTQLPFAREGEQHVDGRIRAAIDLGFALQSERSGPALSDRALASHLGVELWSPRFQAPSRNAPCPCGSGRKSKFCCWGNDERR